MVRTLLKAEETLRELNSRLQGITERGLDKETYELSKQGYYDLRTFRQILEELERTELYLDDVESEYGVYEEGNILESWAEDIRSASNVFCYRQYPWMVCDLFPARTFKHHQDALRERGITCGFIQEDEDRVSFVKAVDSFTNCLHTLALEIAKKIEQASEIKEETGGICTVVELPESNVPVEVCRTYAEWVHENMDDYYHSGDRGKQEGYIYRSKVQFRIGGAPGHTAELDLEDMEFRYYDHNGYRSRALRAAIEDEMGLSCEGWGTDFTCKLRSERDAIEIARLLAFVPSIDIAIEDSAAGLKSECIHNCYDECYYDGEEIEEECKDTCEAECEEEEDREMCMEYCVKACKERACWNDCESECEEETYDVEECAYEGFKAVIRGEADYRDLIDYIFQCY